MEAVGRGEAAIRRQSQALEKTRTFSTVENDINDVRHSVEKQRKTDNVIKVDPFKTSGNCSEEESEEMIEKENGSEIPKLKEVTENSET